MSDEQKIIQGQDLVVKINGKAFLHATEHSLKSSLDVKEVRTIHTNGKKKIPGDLTWSISASGMVIVDPSITEAHSSFEALKLHLKKQLVEVVVSSPAFGEKTTLEGQALITSFDQSAPAGDNMTYSINLDGSEDLTEVTTA